MLNKKTIKTERLELRYPGDVDNSFIDLRNIFLKNSDEKIGQIKLSKDNNELSFFLKYAYHRKGFATEACCVYLKEIFKQTDIDQINDVVRKDNVESIAFHKSFDLPIVKEDDMYHYTITKNQFMEKVKEFNDKKINTNITLDGFGKDIGEIFK
jgi:RimJ/RimL family protein N-acetyltransferase